jgi:hypothetical protein
MEQHARTITVARLFVADEILDRHPNIFRNLSQEKW